MKQDQDKKHDELVKLLKNQGSRRRNNKGVLQGSRRVSERDGERRISRENFEDKIDNDDENQMAIEEDIEITNDDHVE
jgi:hypothetical protein